MEEYKFTLEIPYTRLEDIVNDSDTKQTIQHKCDGTFTRCSAAYRIKLILDKYNKITHLKKNQSEVALQNELNHLINSDICNGQYSNVELLNDFYHIKYNHNANNNPNEFNSFYKYIFYNDTDVLHCDTNNCHSVNRYYNRRNRSIFSSQYRTKEAFSLHLISRIHIYFIHSHDISQLTEDEIHYIEKKLSEYKEKDEDTLLDKKTDLISNFITNKHRNSITIARCADRSKFITPHHQALNYEEIAQILAANDTAIPQQDLSNAFNEYGYRKQQLMDDLCKLLIDEIEENVLLYQILVHELQCNDERKRQTIYGILCHKYIMMKNKDFVKILQILARKYASNVDSDEISKVATSANLTAKIFIKGNPEFKNSIKFGKVFKHLKHFEKKQWTKIYAKINKWKFPKKKKATSMQIENKNNSTAVTEWYDDGIKRISLLSLFEIYAKRFFELK